MTEMTTETRRPLKEYLALQYPFNVVAQPEGGFVILFPDLPGCMTQVEDITEVGAAAEEIRTLWIEAEYEAGDSIPIPSQPATYSGKFNVRLPKSLHQALVESAEHEGTSLNQYVVALLAQADSQARTLRSIRELGRQAAALVAEAKAAVLFGAGFSITGPQLPDGVSLTDPPAAQLLQREMTFADLSR